MPADLSQLLVVAISTSALFDARKEHAFFEKATLEDYVDYQVEHENEPLLPGTAMPLIQAMLRLNTLKAGKRLVEVVILSNMQPAAGLRVMNSLKHHGLDITRAVFTGGEPVARYLKAYNVSLFLSKNETDVRLALEHGIAAGLLYDPPRQVDTSVEQLRIAFDGDAVIFSDEAERVYAEQGLDAFVEHEKANAARPLPEGPFAQFVRSIARIQREYKELGAGGIPPIKTALVTARDGPANERVIRTFRAWGIKLDEMFFLGGLAKGQVLQSFQPHIFFDDQDAHVGPASQVVPAARVPHNRTIKKKGPPEHPTLALEF